MTECGSLLPPWIAQACLRARKFTRAAASRRIPLASAPLFTGGVIGLRTTVHAPHKSSTTAMVSATMKNVDGRVD